MSVLNDDGIPLNLTTVFILFSIPNLTLIILMILAAHLVRQSQHHPRMHRFLGRASNFFAKGALDRVIKNMLKHREVKQRQREGIRLQPQPHPTRLQVDPQSGRCPPTPSTPDFTYNKRHNTNYVMLIPFQIDLLLTVFVYKILTRDTYFETCQSYLTTYHNRPNQVICWLKNTNKNISNLSFNVSLHQYCTNQTITYINFEHNDVICTQYVFKLVNIIDTVTNIFAWHQAVVFLVTETIDLCYWFQQKIRKPSCCSQLLGCSKRFIMLALLCLVLFVYILLFIFIVPIYFLIFERQRVDLTRQLAYACSKFLAAIIVHVNLYTLYQWHLLNVQKNVVLSNKERLQLCREGLVETVLAMENSKYASSRSRTTSDDRLDAYTKTYLKPSLTM